MWIYDHMFELFFYSINRDKKRCYFNKKKN